LISESEAIKIAETLISKGFPELASKSIKYLFVSGKDHHYYMATKRLFGCTIFIENEIRQFSPKAFKGCLAHEFAHIVIDDNKSVLQFFKEFINYEAHKSLDERNADMLVIQRGFGENLYQFHVEHNKDYKAFKKNDGLTKKEVQSILKNRNK